MALNHRQHLFVSEYLVDGNANRAAKAAGYSDRTAAPAVSRLLKNVKVIAEIEKARSEHRARSMLTVEKLMERLDQIYQRCMQVEPVLDSKGNPTSKFRFDASSALRAVELQGKQLGMFRETSSSTSPPDSADEYLKCTKSDLREVPTIELVKLLLDKGKCAVTAHSNARDVRLSVQGSEVRAISGAAPPAFAGLQQLGDGNPSAEE